MYIIYFIENEKENEKKKVKINRSIHYTMSNFVLLDSLGWLRKRS